MYNFLDETIRVVATVKRLGGGGLHTLLKQENPLTYPSCISPLSLVHKETKFAHHFWAG